MSLRPHKQGPGTVIRFKRVQVRNPRRPLEATPEKWELWDRAASKLGLNWSEFTRRALNLHSEAALAGYILGIGENDFKKIAVSEKGGVKKRPSVRAKPTLKRAGRKG